MKIRIEAVSNLEQEAAASRVRREAFGTEWAVELCRIAPNNVSRANQLIARILPGNEAIATLTVLETTGNRALHEKYDLPFATFQRVARYTQMAVLKPYRGLNLPLHLLLEARRRYVIPSGFTYSWLLIPAERAMYSRFCTMLDFSASSRIVIGEQGPSRVLLRDEMCAEADAADLQTKSFLEEVRPRELQILTDFDPDTPVIDYSGFIGEDEWIAH
jgi:hypothetical protein